MIDVKLHLHHNPIRPDEPWKMIARAKSRGKYTFDMMADDISHSCSLGRINVTGCMGTQSLPSWGDGVKGGCSLGSGFDENCGSSCLAWAKSVIFAAFTGDRRRGIPTTVPCRGRNRNKAVGRDNEPYELSLGRMLRKTGFHDRVMKMYRNRVKRVLGIVGHRCAVVGVVSAVCVVLVACTGCAGSNESDYEMLLTQKAALLRKSNGYAPETVRLSMHSVLDSVRTQEIRDYFNIDSIVGDASSTWEKTLALAQFVATHIPHANQTVRPERRNAIALWEYTQNTEPAFNCRLHSIMLFELLSAAGIEANYITCMPKSQRDQDCHVVDQVWLPELNKWAMIDSDFGGNYATDETGTPLSLAEIRERYIREEAIWFHEQLGEGSDSIGFYYAYMAKNTYWFSCWETPGYDQEPPNLNPAPGRYIHLVPKGFRPFHIASTDVVTSDAEAFWKAGKAG